jgi:hypothetical protein
MHQSFERWKDTVRVRFGRQPRLLSTRMAQEKRRVWANVELPGTVSRRWTARLGRVPASWIVIAVAVIVAAVVGEWAFPPKQMTPGADAEIIGRCVEIMIAIVGIIVPLLILVIEFYGREARVTNLVIHETGVLQHVVLVLLGLLFSALVFARTAAYQGYYEGYFPSAMVSGALVGTLALVAETGLLAWRTIMSLRVEAVFQALDQRLSSQLQESVDYELEHRLGRRSVEKLARQHAVLIHPIARYVARQEVALVAHTSGVVTDIRLDRLESFCAGVTTTMSGKEVKAYLTRSVHDQVEQGQPIAYVPRSEQDPDGLQETLNSAFMVAPARPRGPDLKPTLDLLRDMTVGAIQDLSEGIFEQLVGVYVSVCQFHTELLSATGSEAPPPASLADFRPEWPFVILIERDLDVIIDHAVRSQSHVFIDRIAGNLYYIASSALHARDPRMFRFAVERFQALHRYSQAAKAKRGVELTRLYLTGQLADFDVVPALDKTPPDASAVSEVKRYLAILEHAIVELADTSVDYRDPQGFAQTIRDGEELLERYYPRPQLHQDLFAAMKTVQNTSEESPEHQDAVETRAAIDYLLRLKQIHAEEWTQTVFVIGAYIVDLYRQGSVEEDTCAAFMRPILNKPTDLSGLFKALSGALSEEYRWTVFDGMQDTKRAQWIDTQAKYYLLYCLLGIRLSRIVGLPGQPFQSESFGPHDVDVVRARCKEMVEDPRKWAWLTGPTSREDVDAFVRFHEQIVATREERREESIILSELSEEAVALFSSRAHAAARERSAMRYWLERYQALSEVDELPREDCEAISRAVLEDKSTFAERGRSDIAAQLGTFLGEAVAAGLDTCILQALLGTGDGRKAKRPMAPGDALAAARHWLQQTSSSVGLIVVPVRTTATVLHALPEFQYPEAVDEAGPIRTVHGFYGAKPILAVRDDIVGENIVVIDLARACRVLVTSPRTEVRTLSDREIESMMEEKPELTERTPRLRVWARAWQYFKLERVNRDGLLVVQLAGEE